MEASIDKPTLYVCDGDDGGPRMHPCRRVQEALRAAGIEYDKVVSGPGSPFPFLRKGSRDELQAQARKVGLPRLTVGGAQLGGRQISMGQSEAAALPERDDRDLDAGASGRQQAVLLRPGVDGAAGARRPPPGEHDPARRCLIPGFAYCQ